MRMQEAKELVDVLLTVGVITPEEEANITALIDDRQREYDRAQRSAAQKRREARKRLPWWKLR